MTVEEIIRTKESLDNNVCRLGKELEECFETTFYQIDISKLETRTAAFIEARKRRDDFIKRDFT